MAGVGVDSHNFDAGHLGEILVLLHEKLTSLGDFS